jgi:hypothetical protein
MKSKGIVLLAVAIVAIGIFALPSSVSLFSGQHTWYDLSGDGNDVPCEKCHAEIKDEMISIDNGVHETVKCEGCHRTDARVGYALDDEGAVYPGQGAHAASTQECMICHGGGNFTHEYISCSGTSSACHGVPFIAPRAGGFGLTEDAADTGEKAAHLPFVDDSIDDPLMKGANEACISCHTRIGVEITWTKNENLEFDATEDGYGIWAISAFAAGGSNVTYVNTNNTWTNQ